MEFNFSKQPGLKLLNRNLNTDEKALVSIITPFYNAGKYFEQTFNCVMNQTFPWFEWIIVDDGSTNEEDVRILKEFSEKDSRIKVYSKENGGISTARNRAVKESKTEIIITLDADDLIVPTYVETIYWGLYYNEDASWCYTNSIGFHNLEYLWDKPFDANLIKTYNFLTYSAGIRKADILEVGGYYEITKHYYEDWRLWLKLLSESKKPLKLSHYGFWYRRMDTGVLSIVNKDPEIQKLAKKLINEVAEKVDIEVKAKEYPCAGKLNNFKKPKLSTFDKKVFKEKNKTNVMMLIPWMEMGGADLFNLDVVRMIDKSKYEMSILTTVSGENSWRQKFEEHVTDIFELPSFLDVENYAEFISYFIKSRQIDVLFVTNSYFGYYLVPWLRKNFPELVIVDYIHMEEWYWRNGGYARTSSSVGSILEKTYLCNDRTRKVMINDFGRNEDSVETLYIGVDKEKYNRRRVESGIVKSMYEIGESRPIILFPCRMHPQKRPFLMIDIAKELSKKISDVCFLVVGDGPQLEELELKSKSEGLEKNIIFAGRQNDMLPFYRDSDVTLICSLKEGLALTAYESCSMGVPVVSSDVGGQCELIDSSVGAILPLMQNEETDLDVRSFSKEEIELYVNALHDILMDKEKYESLSKNCREKIENKFSSQIMIKKLEEELDMLINDKEYSKKRVEKAESLKSLGLFADDYVTTFAELEIREISYKLGYDNNIKYELMRLASSKWGKRIIKLALKLKLNKLLR